MVIVWGGQAGNQRKGQGISKWECLNLNYLMDGGRVNSTVPARLFVHLSALICFWTT